MRSSQNKKTVKMNSTPTVRERERERERERVCVWVCVYDYEHPLLVRLLFFERFFGNFEAFKQFLCVCLSRLCTLEENIHSLRLERKKRRMLLFPGCGYSRSLKSVQKQKKNHYERKQTLPTTVRRFAVTVEAITTTTTNEK